MWKLPPNVAVVCPEENWYPPTVVGHRWYNVQQDTPASLVVIYFPRWTKLTQTLFKPAVVLFAIFLEPFFLCVCILFLQVFVIFIGLLFRQTLPTNPNQAAQVPGVPGRYFGADDLCSFCFPQWTAGNRPNVYFQQNLGRKPNALCCSPFEVSVVLMWWLQGRDIFYYFFGLLPRANYATKQMSPVHRRLFFRADRSNVPEMY